MKIMTREQATKAQIHAYDVSLITTADYALVFAESLFDKIVSSLRSFDDEVKLMYPIPETSDATMFQTKTLDLLDRKGKTGHFANTFRFLSANLQKEALTDFAVAMEIIEGLDTVHIRTISEDRTNREPLENAPGIRLYYNSKYIGFIPFTFDTVVGEGVNMHGYYKCDISQDGVFSFSVDHRWLVSNMDGAHCIVFAPNKARSSSELRDELSLICDESAYVKIFDLGRGITLITGLVTDLPFEGLITCMYLSEDRVYSLRSQIGTPTIMQFPRKAIDADILADADVQGSFQSQMTTILDISLESMEGTKPIFGTFMEDVFTEGGEQLALEKQIALSKAYLLKVVAEKGYLEPAVLERYVSAQSVRGLNAARFRLLGKSEVLPLLDQEIESGWFRYMSYAPISSVGTGLHYKTVNGLAYDLCLDGGFTDASVERANFQAALLGRKGLTVVKDYPAFSITDEDNNEELMSEINSQFSDYDDKITSLTAVQTNIEAELQATDYSALLQDISDQTDNIIQNDKLRNEVYTPLAIKLIKVAKYVEAQEAIMGLVLTNAAYDRACIIEGVGFKQNIRTNGEKYGGDKSFEENWKPFAALGAWTETETAVGKCSIAEFFSLNKIVPGAGHAMSAGKKPLTKEGMTALKTAFVNYYKPLFEHLHAYNRKAYEFYIQKENAKNKHFKGLTGSGATEWRDKRVGITRASTLVDIMNSYSLVTSGYYPAELELVAEVRGACDSIKVARHAVIHGGTINLDSALAAPFDIWLDLQTRIDSIEAGIPALREKLDEIALTKGTLLMQLDRLMAARDHYNNLRLERAVVQSELEFYKKERENLRVICETKAVGYKEVSSNEVLLTSPEGVITDPEILDASSQQKIEDALKAFSNYWKSLVVKKTVLHLNPQVTITPSVLSLKAAATVRNLDITTEIESLSYVSSETKEYIHSLGEGVTATFMLLDKNVRSGGKEYALLRPFVGDESPYNVGFVVRNVAAEDLAKSATPVMLQQVGSEDRSLKNILDDTSLPLAKYAMVKEVIPVYFKDKAVYYAPDSESLDLVKLDLIGFWEDPEDHWEPEVPGELHFVVETTDLAEIVEIGGDGEGYSAFKQTLRMRPVNSDWRDYEGHISFQIVSGEKMDELPSGPGSSSSYFFPFSKAWELVQETEYQMPTDLVDVVNYSIHLDAISDGLCSQASKTILDRLPGIQAGMRHELADQDIVLDKEAYRVKGSVKSSVVTLHSLHLKAYTESPIFLMGERVGNLDHFTNFLHLLRTAGYKINLSNNLKKEIQKIKSNAAVGGRFADSIGFQRASMILNDDGIGSEIWQTKNWLSYAMKHTAVRLAMGIPTKADVAFVNSEFFRNTLADKFTTDAKNAEVTMSELFILNFLLGAGQ